jgi:FtsH-binding integral membrane protein
MQFSSSRSQPIVLSSSTEAQAYLLFTLAMGLTLAGVFLGMNFAGVLLASGWQIVFVIAELALVFTSSWWSRTSPLNILLFALFPLLSGITVTPYILSVLSGFENGPAILFNAVAATVGIGLSAAAFARLAPGLSAWAGTLLYALIGLLLLSLAQVFVPALRTPGFEMAISGAGILVFAAFTAFDIQRIRQMGAVGANPFTLALGLYLDIFNLFLSVLRFMTALSGDRR